MRIRGERPMEWPSHTWFEVVGSGDERHLRAGTRLDYDDSISAAIDPKRAAAYFAGYCQKNKEAQHEPPEGWANENGSVGRYWGQRGLETAPAQVRITRQDDIELRRIMRKLVRSQKRTVQRKVGRNYETIQTLDGEVVHPDGSVGDGSHFLTPLGRSRVITSRVATKARRVNRRYKLRSLSPAGPAADGERGFMIFCNDAPLLAAQLARLVSVERPT